MNDLTGQRILITSGPTWAPIDAVRYIGNRSSGRFGTAVADACWSAGAQVTFLAGPGSMTPSISPGAGDRPDARNGESLAIVRFETLDELAGLMDRQLKDGGYHAVIQAVAGLDFVPEGREEGKIPSDRDTLELRLVRAPKLIETIKRIAPDTVLVGCKLETGLDDDALVDRAEDLRTRSGAEMVVANRVEEVGASGHRALLVSWPEGIRVVMGPLDGREQIAAAIVEWLVHHLPTPREDSHES